MSAPKKFTARWLPWLLLGAVLVVALVVGSRPESNPSLNERTRSVAETLRCPECTDKSMAASEAPTSAAGKAEIRRQLVAGRTPTEIRSWFASRYGEDILLTPSRRGVQGLIWAIPVVAFVVASAVLAGAFIRWRRRVPDAVSDEDRQLVASARHRTESDTDGDVR